MEIWITCSRCGEKVSRNENLNVITCPKCGSTFSTQEYSSEEDFPIWEGDFNATDIQYPEKGSKDLNERSPKPPGSHAQHESEICKCLGTVEKIDCNTYYFVSSVKSHGGCARRDCSNSFENNPRIALGWENEIRKEYEKSNSGQNVTLIIVGIVLMLMGTANPIFIAFGIFILLLGILLPWSSKGVRYEKINFRLVKKTDVPKHAKDPWTQRSIWE